MQRQLQNTPVASLHKAKQPVEPARDHAVPFPPAQDLGGHHGRERERHKAREGHGDAQREAELRKHAPGIARHEGHGHKHTHEHQRGRHHGKGHLPSAFEGSHQRMLAVLDAAMDIFQHHDRVIDDQSDR